MFAGSLDFSVDICSARNILNVYAYRIGIRDSWALERWTRGEAVVRAKSSAAFRPFQGAIAFSQTDVSSSNSSGQQDDWPHLPRWMEHNSEFRKASRLEALFYG